VLNENLCHVGTAPRRLASIEDDDFDAKLGEELAHFCDFHPIKAEFGIHEFEMGSMIKLNQAFGLDMVERPT
jgi:hypothetical protein